MPFSTGAVGVTGGSEDLARSSRDERKRSKHVFQPSFVWETLAMIVDSRFVLLIVPGFLLTLS